MRKKHQKILDDIFYDPALSNIKWDDIVSLLFALGAEISEGKGSRIRVVLGGVKAVFHRPHPKNETDKGTVKSMRKFLENAGIRERQEE
jgi:hypothetical protein